MLGSLKGLFKKKTKIEVSRFIFLNKL